jgi:hypothetical protein
MSVERNIRFDLIARLCPNTTGAELRSVTTEAGMFAIRQRRKVASEKDFLDAVEKVIRQGSKFSSSGVSQLFYPSVSPGSISELTALPSLFYDAALSTIQLRVFYFYESSSFKWLILHCHDTMYRIEKNVVPSEFGREECMPQTNQSFSGHH